ncbi:hypothetical protein N483_27115 [Pseudoalteromonas luteoviolacea NCIMB 1944]|nr:hypothetical protein N483_27115 [Pseudoalteromonas luteoviolacea NCIMB 1944]
MLIGLFINFFMVFSVFVLVMKRLIYMPVKLFFVDLNFTKVYKLT